MNSDLLLMHFNRISDAPGALRRLRRFVLDLAVRGKLVDQDPNDEAASELLKNIWREKARKGYKESRKSLSLSETASISQLVYTVPVGWAATTLGEVAEKITDGTHKTPNYVDHGVPFVSVKDFSGGKLEFGRTRFISPEEHALLFKRCDPRRGDILIGRIGTLGKAVLVETDIEFSLFVSVGLIRFSHDFVEPSFLRLLLNSPLVEAEFDRIKVGGGTHTNKLNLGDLHAVNLPLPPLAEQHRIVAKVDELMALCDRLEAAQREREIRRDRFTASTHHHLNNGADPEALCSHSQFFIGHLLRITSRPEQINQLRQTILNLAVRGKLVEQDPDEESATRLMYRIAKQLSRTVEASAEATAAMAFSAGDPTPFGIPASWAWVRLGSICSKTGSGSTPRGGKSVYQRIGVPFLRSQNIHNDGLRLDDVAYISLGTHDRMAGTAVEAGDLLLNITGGSIGRCCLVSRELGHANVSQHVAIIRAAINGLQSYLHYLILSPYFQTFVIGEQTGAGRLGLPKNRMDRIPVALPPLTEQHRIVAKVDELMTLCDQLEAMLETAKSEASRLLESVLHNALADIPEAISQVMV